MASFTFPPLPNTRRPSSIAPQYASVRRAPRQFVRLHRTHDGKATLQTASTAYLCNNFALHIHSVVHIAERSYYESLQYALDEMSAREGKGAVLYELIAPGELRKGTGKGGVCRVEGVRATEGVRRAARRLGCMAQADVMEVGKKGWYVADLSAEEVRQVGKGRKGENKKEEGGISWRWMRGVGRAVVAGLLPGPEVFGVLLGTMDGGMLVLNGEMVWRVLRRLVIGDVRGARRVLYGERVISDGRGGGVQDAVSLRRDVEVFEGVRWLVERGVREVGVVYGAWHGGHLCRWAEEEMRMTWEGTEWRCAMEIWNEAGSGAGSGLVGGVWGVVVGLSFLWYGGWDWIGVVRGVVGGGEMGDWGVVGDLVGWYVVRHLVGFLALTRWLAVNG